MLDYLFDQETGQPAYIEANPRLGETMNATLSGVNLADLLVRLSHQPSSLPVSGPSQPGVQSHILLAVLLGMATRGKSRFALFCEVIQALVRRGQYAQSQEEWVVVKKRMMVEYWHHLFLTTTGEDYYEQDSVYSWRNGLYWT
jgi:hypothetical protein